MMRSTALPARAPLPFVRPEPSGRRPAGLVLAAGVVCALAFVWVMLTGDYNQFAGVLVAMVLFLATVPLARHAARIEADPALAWIVMGAMVARLGGAAARYVVAYGLYGGVADASTYTQVAQSHYHAFRHLHFFTPTTGVFHGLVPFIDTIVYGLAGPTELGAFFVFGWFNLIGCYLFYRAFRIGFPAGDGRRYALIVFFLPSMVYWPSSLGKEGWMIFVLGLASYGLARALKGRPGGYLALMAGIGGMLLVRPHLALIFLPAAALSFLLRRPAREKKRPIGRLAGIVVMVACSLVVVAKAQSYFGIKNLDVQTVTQELKTTKQQTAIGNSAFHAPNARSPIGYPEAAVTVLFRPFPFEAHSSAVLVSSGEGLVLLALTAMSWRRLKRIPRMLWREPYVLFSLIYTALFILAFSNFSNFGILARERVQTFPMFLVLLAIPALAGRGGRATGPEAEPAAVAGKPGRRPGATVAAPRRPAPAMGNHTGPVRRSGPAPARRVLGPYRALDHRFAVEVSGGGGGAYLAEGLGAALVDLDASPNPAGERRPVQRYRLACAGQAGGGRVRVDYDGRLIGEAASPAGAAAILVADVNRRAVASRPDQLVVHAAAVSYPGGVVLLPGEPGAGKSTLAAGLVSAGFSYLTDEAAAIDLDRLSVDAYPKPVSLDAASIWALGDRLPPGAAASASFSVNQTAPSAGREATTASGTDFEYFVPASALGSGVVDGPQPLAVIVFARYRPGSATMLSSMGRAEALVELGNNSFNFVDHGGAWLPGLRRLVLACSCWRLSLGDLDAACGLVTGLSRVAQVSPARTGDRDR